jgi:glycosyltransferase involved in cell wall biosynthesis
LFGKAVISTPLNIAVDDFFDEKNYLKLTDRSSYQELPDKIELLLKDKRYLEMGENNLKWSKEYIHPKNYIHRILSVITEIK